MATSRLRYAEEAGALNVPPTGNIALFRPPLTADISMFPRERTTVFHGFFPDYQGWKAAGYRTAVSASGQFALAVVFVPRAKALAHAMIARAMEITGGGPVILDGGKLEGIDSLLRACRKAGAQVGAVVSKAHGKVFSIERGDFAAWQAPQTMPISGGFITAPGVFSADAADPGSGLLAQAFAGKLAGRVCDLGAGWGYLSHAALTEGRLTECHLVEAEHAALECARQNVADSRAVFHWADALDFDGAAHFDHVITNPPFHQGRKAEVSLGRGFIASARRLLARTGTLWLVANRHLPYDKDLSAAFQVVEEMQGSASFKVFRAARARR